MLIAEANPPQGTPAAARAGAAAGKLRSVQCLRGIAALFVALTHLLPETFGIGAAGVDIFFVISGFIMATIGVREPVGAFLVKRIARIVPLYWAVTLFMCGMALVPGLFDRFSFDAARLIKSLLFIPYRDLDGVIWPLVQVGWTLNFEMFFYAVFALCLLVGRPVMLGIALLIGLVLAGRVLAPDHPVLITWTSPLLLEFVFGLGITLVRRPLGRFAAAGPVAFAAGAVGLALAAASGVIPDNQGARFLFWGLPALLLVLGAILMEDRGLWPRAAEPLVWFGDLSFGFYLLHGLVIAVVYKVLPHGLPAAALVLVIATIAAFVSFRLFERPVGNAIQRLAGVGRSRPRR